MKILLLRPPFVDIKKYNRETALTPAPPLSLACLGSVLKKENYAVKVFDLFYSTLEEAKKIIIREKPDILGLTSSTDHRMSMVELAQIAKSINSNIKVVAGGPHASVMYDQLLKNYPIDVTVIGEGENTFPELVKTFEKNTGLEQVQGVAFKVNDKVVKTESRKYIENLDSLPFPDWSPFNFNDYPKDALTGLNPAYICASRGCPYNCRFCTVSSVWSTKWRTRSPQNIADEMEILAGKYGRKYLRFVDDTFTMDSNNTIELCREIIKRKLNVSWDCTTRVNLVNEELLPLMKKAGCCLIQYGVESGAGEVLEKAGKGITKEQVVRAFKITRETGINTNAFLMVGNPGDNEKTFKETQNLLKIINADSISVASTIIFPGTALYDYCKNKGFIDDSYWLTQKPAPICTIENNFEQIQLWANTLMYPYLPFLKKMLYRLSVFKKRYFPN